MRRSCLPAVLFVAASGACVAPPQQIGLPREYPAVRPTLRVGVRLNGRIQVQQVALETYVEATVLSEFAPATGESGLVQQMLELQAVISRTYALGHLGRHGAEGFDLCATTHCQLYDSDRRRTSRWASLARAAVSASRGQVLWFEGAPAETLFHADCGGATTRADEVWGGLSRPYLVGRKDDGPAATAHSGWTFEASLPDLRGALNADTRTAVGSRLDGLTVLERDASGRARRVALRGAQDRIVKGEDLRVVLTSRFGPRSVRSTWFSVRRTGTALRFDGRGFGHGVGLCQAGALACLRAGTTRIAVLHRYYPGTMVVTLASPSPSAQTGIDTRPKR